MSLTYALHLRCGQEVEVCRDPARQWQAEDHDSESHNGTVEISVSRLDTFEKVGYLHPSSLYRSQMQMAT